MGSEYISIIVPTINESENLPLLVPRVAAVMDGRKWEMIIVDDNSRDNTAAVCADLATHYPLKLSVRKTPTHGLSGAVLHGFAQARGDVLVCMDADLQHPPEKLPELIDAVIGSDADFSLGSRHQPGGGTEQTWGLFRQLNSWVATMLAMPFSGGVKDPMSGFFALRRSTFEKAERLSPLGYKIALELMCKCRVKHVQEVPIHFGLRLRGQSKLSLKQQFHYLQHLSRLYDFTYPRASPILKFLLVLSAGWLVGAATCALALSRGAGWVASIAAGYLVNVLITAVFHSRYIHTQREFLVSRHPWGDFVLIAVGELTAAISAAAWLIWRLPNPGFAEVFLISFGLGTAVRYLLRKEMLQDIRGLRREIRADELR